MFAWASASSLVATARCALSDSALPLLCNYSSSAFLLDQAFEHAQVAARCGVPRFESAGWTVFELPVNLETLRPALTSKNYGGTTL